MANYYGQTRSNYFRVVDVDKFKEVCKDFELEFIENDEGKVGFYSNSESGISQPLFGWEDKDGVSGKYDDNTFETVDELIASMLEDNEVMIITHIGSEKMRFLNGYASAYNNKGEFKNIDLWDIHKLGLELGNNVTDCSY